MRISIDKLVRRQMLVALFAVIFLLGYAAIVNRLELFDGWNLVVMGINMLAMVGSLFGGKWMVELIYGVKFKDYRWYDAKLQENEK